MYTACVCVCSTHTSQRAKTDARCIKKKRERICFDTLNFKRAHRVNKKKMRKKFVFFSLDQLM